MKTIETKPSIGAPCGSMMETEQAIEKVKTAFPQLLASELNLKKVSAPLVVLKGTGINDDLNGIERSVKFPIRDMNEQIGEVVHSLAKWKRVRLKELGTETGQGILTDMRALRSDEDFSPIHSIYVDQWDWEQRIEKSDRTLPVLKNTVRGIYRTLRKMEAELFQWYPALLPCLPPEITFLHSEEVAQQFPDLTPKEREHKVTQLYGAVFLIGIGGALSSGEPHDGRAPDYDDWSTPTENGYCGLNGDLLVWNPVLGQSFELSSMGIRVDEEAMLRQLKIRGCEDRKSLLFHRMLLNKELPYSIGGGIGQSRLCMFLLRKRHIGEVQVSIWPEEVRSHYRQAGIDLL